MIEIISPGLFTTAQDLGRWGYQAYGMPVAGAVDKYAYQVANLLAGNTSSAAALEMTMLGGTFRFADSCYAAICGADMTATLNNQPIANWTSFHITAGSVLKFGYASNGCRAYLAVHGGINVPKVLNSYSTYSRGAIGGFQGRPLQTGYSLDVCKECSLPNKELSLPEKYIPQYQKTITLRVLLGPQDYLFTDDGIQTLLSSEYEITDEADRMGCRLDGPTVKHLDKADIVSDALPLGAIQVPPDGKPIIMLADRQTTGGYAKIGTVISSDISRLAQGKPGDKIRFTRCRDDEAVAALAAEYKQYQEIEAWIQNQMKNITTNRLNIRINNQTFTVDIEESC